MWIKMYYVIAVFLYFGFISNCFVSGSQIGACASNPCINDGICSDSPNGFICTCINGYVGVRCEQKSDECPLDSTIKCLHGKCRLMSDGRPTCHCFQGYGGPFCEKDLSSCQFTPCMNNGTCINEKEGYRCACTKYYKGSHCQINQEEIDLFLDLCKTGNGFLHGGRCWHGKNSTITVGWGYGSNLCNSIQSCFDSGNVSGVRYTDVQLKPVQMELQQSLKFLTDTDASLYDFQFIPHILPMETESDNAFLDCNKNNSLQLTHADGTGQLVVNSSLLGIGLHYFIADVNAIHRCQFGLRLNVSVKTHDCTGPTQKAQKFCNGYGICYTDYTLTKYQCKCHGSRIGKYCERENPCSKLPCKFGGTCRIASGTDNMFEEFICDCPAGRTGMDCSELSNKCLSKPCSNGGTCHPVGDGFHCSCPHGFVGDTCQINVNECASNPCKNGAACVDGQHSFNCICPPGFKGTLCEVDLNECHSNPCINGTCIDGTNAFSCHCDAGYSGILCDVALDECLSSPCINGKCLKLTNGYKCSCGIGYTGPLCGVKVDLCQDSVHCISANAKACKDYGHNVSCICRNGFQGANCGVNINDCQRNPCKNHGVCIDKVGGFDCHCKAGYYGQLCEEVITQPPKSVNPTADTATPQPTFEIVLIFNSSLCHGSKIGNSNAQLANAISTLVIETCNCSMHLDNFIASSMKAYCNNNQIGTFMSQISITEKVTTPTVLCSLNWEISKSHSPHKGISRLVAIQTDTAVCTSDRTKSYDQDSSHLDVGFIIGLVVGAIILIVALTISAVKFRNLRLERVSSISEKRKRIRAYINLTYEGGWVRGFDDEPVLHKISSDDFFDPFEPVKENSKV